MRFRAWKALCYSNDAKLSPEIAGKLFASPLHASVTRIESFATCPFKHFAQYGLKLPPREDGDVTVMDLGNVRLVGRPAPRDVALRLHGFDSNSVAAMGRERSRPCSFVRSTAAFLPRS